MAGSLLLLFDDIASVLDDVATMTKAAASKTAGVIGDDIALNAKQVAGVAAARELEVVWAVAKGSALNKLVLVPAALLLGWLAPWLVTPLMVIGGLWLCFEGAEKIIHRLAGHHAGSHAPAHAGHAGGDRSHEPATIAAAIRTDFILSAEIIVITLGVVAASSPVTRIAVVSLVAAGMTVGVYGLVAAIVKLDDVGAVLATQASPVLRRLGRGIIAAAPGLMRLLSIAGTAAMFLVGGGILAHSLPALHDAIHGLTAGLEAAAGHGASWPATLATAAAEGAVGLVAGFALAGAALAARRLGWT